MILEVKNLIKRFPVERGIFAKKNIFIHAVDNVSFDISECETVGLVGESGCGKSTIGKIILNLIEQDSGEVIFLGENIGKIKKEELRKLRRNVQIIFQDPFASLNPRMKIKDIIGEPIEVHRTLFDEASEKRVYELLDLVGLSKDFYERFPHEMSGGQRQRVAIARSLAISPKLIVADEPLSSLDVSIQKDIMDLFIRLQREYKISYLFISHDLRIVKKISARIFVMYLAKIVESGRVDLIFSHPMHPYTKALISAVPKDSPLIEKERIILSGEIPSQLSPPSGCRFRTRCWRGKNICAELEPELRELEKEHKVACHFPLCLSKS